MSPASGTETCQASNAEPPQPCSEDEANRIVDPSLGEPNCRQHPPPLLSEELFSSCSLDDNDRQLVGRVISSAPTSFRYDHLWAGFCESSAVLSFDDASPMGTALREDQIFDATHIPALTRDVNLLGDFHHNFDIPVPAHLSNNESGQGAATSWLSTELDHVFDHNCIGQDCPTPLLGCGELGSMGLERYQGPPSNPSQNNRLTSNSSMWVAETDSSGYACSAVLPHTGPSEFIPLSYLPADLNSTPPFDEHPIKWATNVNKSAPGFETYNKFTYNLHGQQPASEEGSMSRPHPPSNKRSASPLEPSPPQDESHRDFKFVLWNPHEPIYLEKEPTDVPDPHENTKLRKLRDSEGRIQGTLSVIGSRPGKRKSLTPKQRQETSQARKFGICQRCRVRKTKCDLAQQVTPYESCSACHSKTYRGVARMPCFQSSLFDMTFFRMRPFGPLFTRRPEVYDLVSASKCRAPIKKVLIKQLEVGPELVIYAAEFDPLPTDNLAYNWTNTDGQRRTMPMPNYSLALIPTVEENMRNYIRTSRQKYFDQIKESDLFAHSTFMKTAEYAESKPSSLVDLSLNIWATGRLIEHKWRITGDESIGVEPARDPTCPWFGQRVLPPIMDSQLDQIVIQKILMPLKARLQKKLHEQFCKHLPATWFELYLSSFVLLNHTAWCSKHGRKFAKKYGLGKRYCDDSEFEGYFHSAKILIAHFRFVSNGAVPLRLDWTKTTTKEIACLREDEATFMTKTVQEIKEQTSTLLALRTQNEYEADMFWCQQLFFETWDISAPHIAPVQEL